MGVTATDPSVAQAFDAIASEYDRTYTDNPSMRLMRRRVWKELRRRIAEGQRVLELGCGTGEDAVFLAEAGCEVLATDCSTRMLERAASKCTLQGLERNMRFELLEIGDISRQLGKLHGEFDGILSNFGGLNTVKDLGSLQNALYELLKPGGWFMATVMGPLCLWDWVSELARFRPGSARNRRPRNGTRLALGGHDVFCYFPSVRGFRRAFHRFRLDACQALGLLLPPPRITAHRDRLRWLWALLDVLERPLARMWLLRGWGDHYLVVLVKDERS
jgi:ubiquinone/menaquinone biosynthesis C-methylase UbiE